MTAGVRFRDCLRDPGELTGDAAVYALIIHFACPEVCKRRWRGLAAIDEEYVANPAAVFRSPLEDAAFADLLREAIRATQDVSGHY